MCAPAISQCRAWRIGEHRTLSLDRPRLIGILNVTPDSFSDGGRYVSVEDAVNAALAMVNAGACIIDVGGESTRPGAMPVDADEQIRRTVPVIRALRQASRIGSQTGDSHLFLSRETGDCPQLLVSIDTTRAKVAETALEAGADIINDISAGRDDEGMLPLAAAASRRPEGCGLILTHRRTAPARDSFSDQYESAPDYGGDVVAFVRHFLKERMEAAISAGIPPPSIVIDPGLGFGKSVEQNFELIRRSGELIDLGCPVLSAASSKSFIGAASGESVPANRVAGSVAVSIAHYLAGVRLFRVHDVAAHRQALAVTQAIRETRQFSKV